MARIELEPEDPEVVKWRDRVSNDDGIKRHGTDNADGNGRTGGGTGGSNTNGAGQVWNR